MRLSKVLLVLAAAGAGVAAPLLHAQATPFGSIFTTPRLEISGGYNYIKANAPPSGCECFSLNGGFVSADYNFSDWLSVTGRFTDSQASHISALGQNLTLMTYMGGPKVSLRRGRFIPFGEILFGEAHGSDSYFPTATNFTTSASSFAISAGGGLDINLTKHFAVRVPEVGYLRTGFPNAANNQQNQLMIGAGIVLKLGSRSVWSPAPVPAPTPSEIASFSCSASANTVEPGQMLRINSEATTAPHQERLSYAWQTSGGNVTGVGRSIGINTIDVPPGDYTVSGMVSLVSTPSVTQTCEVSFRVSAPAPKPAAATEAPPAPPTATEVRQDKEFHDNVPDALFDYDSYAIRPDGQEAIEHAAAYLMSHPTINVIIAGYSDERGSAEYNIALGQKRANATRDVLMRLGVPGQRLRIVSYGKETPVCSTQNEACYQQNRRAAFAMSR